MPANCTTTEPPPQAAADAFLESHIGGRLVVHTLSTISTIVRYDCSQVIDEEMKSEEFKRRKNNVHNGYSCSL